MLALLILTVISWVTLAHLTPRLTGDDVQLAHKDPWSFLTAFNYVVISGLLSTVLFTVFPGLQPLVFSKPILLLLTQVLLGAVSLQLSTFLTPGVLQVRNFGAALLASGAITLVTLLVSLLLRAL